ncbi:unnamed protein product [Clonostachys chloroleuca]|uniref:RecQ-mediated genome instability protein 1 n=1 Tax=Clonostachys chloroleuca TaxID=1926264 RepID=A0AA35Q2F0_9HYPO|nr:unnamed protein product [Clonostachys chloroleuca]
MDLASQLHSSILSQSLPPPSQTFVTSLIAARNPPPPLASLVATAKSRLLACDLSSSPSLDSASLAVFPAGVENTHLREQSLQRDTYVQVLDIENLSLSRWEQIEELESIEKGERTRGREIIRVTADQDGSGGEPQQQQRATPSNATHRLVLQDRSGKKVYGLELRRVPQIGVGKTKIGEKLILKAGTRVARGSVMLTPETCQVLGGKVEAWHKTWTESRIARLKEAIGGDQRA